MRIAVVHNQVFRNASAADRDVLAQVSAVSQSLERLGHEAVTVDATLDLKALRSRLSDLHPDIVFNLVESLDGSDWLMFLATGLFDAMGLPYTGSPTEAVLLANHKLLAKERLRQEGLPTPDWLSGRASQPGRNGKGWDGQRFRLDVSYILKAVAEHASVGLGDACVVAADDENALRRRLEEHAKALGCACFAEHYVDGREFNLSLLASPDGPEVLPAAEIDFSAFPPGKPRIVGYEAKWEAGSFEYDNTPRGFDFPDADGALVSELSELAIACWNLFGLRGYGRVDFRVDARRCPWILEVNANPCLSPDAGYAAVLARASIPFEKGIERILDDAMATDNPPTI
ncbi:MAG: D-alanine--D-alanine ligase [Planctomycetota bacterium]